MNTHSYLQKTNIKMALGSKMKMTCLMVFIAFSEHNNIDKTNILFSGSLINT